MEVSIFNYAQFVDEMHRWDAADDKRLEECLNRSKQMIKDWQVDEKLKEAAIRQAKYCLAMEPIMPFF